MGKCMKKLRKFDFLGRRPHLLTVGDQNDPDQQDRHKSIFGAMMTLVFLITSAIFISIYSTRVRSDGFMKVQQYMLHKTQLGTMNFTDADIIPTVRFYSFDSSTETIPSGRIFQNYRVQFQHTDNNSTATDMVPCGSVSYKLPEAFATNSKFREEYLCPQELGQFNFTGFLNNIVMLDS